MHEILWLFRMGCVLWVAWRAVLLLDIMNPLMGVLIAIVCMVGGPLALSALADAYSGNSEMLDLYASTTAVNMGAPLAFALMGVFMWSLVEGIRRP